MTDRELKFSSLTRRRFTALALASAGTGLTAHTPLAADMASAPLGDAIARIPRISSFLLLRKDTLQQQFFARGQSLHRPINIKSASKSILSALTALALQRGELASLDTPIHPFLTRYFERIPTDDPRRGITVRHLLTMSSGLPSTSIFNYGAWVTSRDWIGYVLNQTPQAPPGTRMTYSTGDTHLLAAVLTQATGQPLRTYAQRHLFDPLDAQIGGWDRDPQGVYFGGNNLALSPAALLAFGKLYRDAGQVGARQILTPAWIDASWTPHFRNSSYNTRHDYGYLWWHGRFGGHSAWFAWGYGGQFLFVLPALAALAVLTGDPDARTRGGNEAIYRLMDEVVVPDLVRSFAK